MLQHYNPNYSMPNYNYNSNSNFNPNLGHFLPPSNIPVAARHYRPNQQNFSVFNSKKPQQYNHPPYRTFKPKQQLKTTPTINTAMSEAISVALKESLEFTKSEDCSTAAKHVITLLSHLLAQASPTAINPVDEHRRQHSIIISGLSESESEFPQERAEEDTAEVKNLLDVLDIEAMPITVYRMGERDNDRPRLIKVEMPTKGHIRLIHQNKARLAKSKNYSTVRIRPSMTKEQRESRKLLIDQCNDMRKKDNTNQYDYVIWRNQVVARAEIPTLLTKINATQP